MNLYKPSTEKQPLLFFKTFLSRERLEAYENHFYEPPTNDYELPFNRSLQNNKGEGYIEYHKDFYEDGEAPLVRIYFVDNLQMLLRTQANITLRFLSERRLQKEFDEVFENGFVQRQLKELHEINESTQSLPHNRVIQVVLFDLKDKITAFLYAQGKERPTEKFKRPQKESNPFFGNKQKTTFFRLKKLYDEILDIGLIDEEQVTEEAFTNVFTSKTPERKIFFNRDNYEVVYFLDVLSAYFDDLTPVQIGRSKSFITKGDTVITAGLINTYNSRLQNKDKSKYDKIRQAVTKAIPSQE